MYETIGWLCKGELSSDVKQLRGSWGGSRTLWHGTFILTFLLAKTEGIAKVGDAYQLLQPNDRNGRSYGAILRLLASNVA